MKNKTIILFILLLITYYVVNLLTSDEISGMSGRIQAKHNIYNQLMIGVIILYMAFSVFFKKIVLRTSTEKVALLLLLWVVLREVFVLIVDDRLVFSNLNPFFSVVFWLLGFVFCIDAFRGVEEKKINKYLACLTIVYLLFVTYRSVTQKAILRDAEILGGINVAGSIYMIVPLIMLTVNNKWKAFLFGYCILLAIYSAKREAVAGMAIVSFFMFYDFIKEFFRKNKTRNFLLLFLLLIGLYFGKGFLEKLSQDFRARSEYFEESGADIDSGREILREAAMVGFENAPIAQQLFGGGAGQAKRYIIETIANPRFPHNGLIELTCDYGYLGGGLFVFFFISIFLLSRKMGDRKDKFICYSILGSWCLSFYVYHAANLILIYFAITIGYLYNKSHISHKYEKK